MQPAQHYPEPTVGALIFDKRRERPNEVTR